jgi:hypothetical protein
MLEAQRIGDNDFEPDVEAVTVELHNYMGGSPQANPSRRRREADL